MFTSENPAQKTMPSKAGMVTNAQLLGHDIRSALSGVLGALSLVDAVELSASNKANFDQAQVSAKMILALLDGAREILGLGEAQSPALKAKTNLEDGVKNLKLRWHQEAKQKGITLDFTLPESAVEIGITKLDFARIYNNILGNALKFTNNGSIFVEFSVVGNQLISKITDSGPGFSDGAFKTLFLFEGRPEGAQKQGTGLGLFIAKSLVEAAAGSIEARNSTGVGAVITITLPCSEKRKIAKRPSTGDLPDLSHLKILMAEDNLTNQMVAKQMLKAMNATCVLASDGVEAVEKFEAEDFDLCLIDIEMPRMSGLEVMRNIRSRPDARAATPLIALTAYVLPEHQERINAAGASGLISKPLTNIAEFGLNILSFASPVPVAAPEASQEEANIDGCIDFTIYDGLADMIGPESMKELLDKVKTDIESVKSGVSDGLKNQDTDVIGSHTHILISVAGAIGAVGLQHQAQSLNSLSKTSNWGDIAQGVNACVSGCSDVLAFVESRL